MKLNRKPLNRTEKWILAATVLCGALLFGATSWWRAQNADAIVAIPNPKLPNPNAYDLYVAATQQISPISKSRINFAITRYQARTAIPVMPSSFIKSSLTNKTSGSQKREYSIKEKLWLLKQNVRALQTLRKGFAFPYLQPPSRSD